MDIDNYQDIIDVRDIIAAYEAIEGSDEESDESFQEAELRNLLSDLRGNGGDHQWRGDWYPVTLIRDSYFKQYAQELAEDIGAIPENYSWHTSCIDWDQATRELQMDYTTIEYDGVTYWYR